MCGRVVALGLERDMHSVHEIMRIWMIKVLIELGVPAIESKGRNHHETE